MVHDVFNTDLYVVITSNIDPARGLYGENILRDLWTVQTKPLRRGLYGHDRGRDFLRSARGNSVNKPLLYGSFKLWNPDAGGKVSIFICSQWWAPPEKLFKSCPGFLRGRVAAFLLVDKPTNFFLNVRVICIWLIQFIFIRLVFSHFGCLFFCEALCKRPSLLNSPISVFQSTGALQENNNRQMNQSERAISTEVGPAINVLSASRELKPQPRSL